MFMSYDKNMEPKNSTNMRKAVMIGCGFVGSATVFSLMQSGLFSELLLIDADRAKAEGESKPKTTKRTNKKEK